MGNFLRFLTCKLLTFSPTIYELKSFQVFSSNNKVETLKSVDGDSSN